MAKITTNPFKPGAGHSPPHLAGRDQQIKEFSKLLEQNEITKNAVLTGLRGVGKTVLMDDAYKPLAQKEGWVWVGSDFSESAFVDEKSLCQRIITDLSLFTSTLSLTSVAPTIGFSKNEKIVHTTMTYAFLWSYFDQQAGLTVDKLKATLEFVWGAVQARGKRGVIFAYDEAQVVQDRKDKEEYPLAILLETFQSLQRKGMRYMLLLTGLPTLFPKLVASRTYAERMFTIQEIGRLEKRACKEAIQKPLEHNIIQFHADSVELIVDVSACYPYFIQFICRESYDHFKLQLDSQPHLSPSIPINTLVRKLDADFFAGRWSRVTDRQREMLFCIANLETATDEFTVAEIVESSRAIAKNKDTKIKAFKTGDVNQMLPKLIDAGLLYKNRHGKYSLAVPLFDSYIKRQFENDPSMPLFHK